MRSVRSRAGINAPMIRTAASVGSALEASNGWEPPSGKSTASRAIGASALSASAARQSAHGARRERVEGSGSGAREDRQRRECQRQRELAALGREQRGEADGEAEVERDAA